MRIIFWGNGNRGVACFQKLIEKGYSFECVITHPNKGKQWYGSVYDLAEKNGFKTLAPEDPNNSEMEDILRAFAADLFILAGYGFIIKDNIIQIPRLMCINLHAGELPKYRGSSPLNWCLINGESTFTLSIIKVNQGVDTGDLICQKTHRVDKYDTIKDLHCKANEAYPGMLLEVVRLIEKDEANLVKQNEDDASYYPLRFPDDGFILWDMLTAEQVHNRIRALTNPYPCATAILDDRKIRLIASRYSKGKYFGEPGRIYLKSDKGILVCCSDRCLWITEAEYMDTGESIFESVKRYQQLLTVKNSILRSYEAVGDK